jgi:hypothetical protein
VGPFPTVPGQPFTDHDERFGATFTSAWRDGRSGIRTCLRASVGSTEASDGRLGAARVGPIDGGVSDRIGSGGADKSRAIRYQRSSRWTWSFSFRRTLSLPRELAFLIMKFLLVGEHR